MTDFLKRVDDGTFEEVRGRRLRTELAGDTMRNLTALMQGREIVGYDGDTEYTLSFNDDGAAYLWLEARGENVNYTVSFKQVEGTGEHSYFLLDEDDDVKMTIKNLGESAEQIDKTLLGLAYGYTGGPLE